MPREFPVEVLERGKGPTDVIKSKIVSPVSVCLVKAPLRVSLETRLFYLVEKKRAWLLLFVHVQKFDGIPLTNDVFRRHPTLTQLPGEIPI